MNKLNYIILSIESQIKLIKEMAIMIENSIQNYVSIQNNDLDRLQSKEIEHLNNFSNIKLNNSVSNMNFNEEEILSKNINKSINDLKKQTNKITHQQTNVKDENKTDNEQTQNSINDNQDFNSTNKSHRINKNQSITKFLESMQTLDFNPLDFPYIYLKEKKMYRFQKMINGENILIYVGNIKQNHSEININILTKVINKYSDFLGIDISLKQKVFKMFEDKINNELQQYENKSKSNSENNRKQKLNVTSNKGVIDQLDKLINIVK